MSSAHPAIVAARFGKPTEDGGFRSQAEPLGRSQLETTLRAALQKNAPRRMASMEDITKSVEDMFSHVNPDRKRVIAEIEPVGNCRAVSSITYACRVLIERNDPLMSMFGMPADILYVEFTFERSAGGVSWRVSDDVDARYTRHCCFPEDHCAPPSRDVMCLRPRLPDWQAPRFSVGCPRGRPGSGSGP